MKYEEFPGNTWKAVQPKGENQTMDYKEFQDEYGYPEQEGADLWVAFNQFQEQSNPHTELLRRLFSFSDVAHLLEKSYYASTIFLFSEINGSQGRIFTNLETQKHSLLSLDKGTHCGELIVGLIRKGLEVETLLNEPHAIQALWTAIKIEANVIYYG